MTDPLFASMFSTPEMQEAVSGRAWLRAMLDVEAALARAQGSAGVIPAEAASAIVEGCRTVEIEPGGIAEAVLGAANPAGPLIDAVAARLPGEAADWLHFGATSQDVVDSALVLLTRRALQIVLRDVERSAAAAASLSDRHRGTVVAGRTLLQQAAPTTFGLKAAGWLNGLVDCVESIERLLSALPAQLGGSVGSLSALGADGVAVSAAFARELGLREPVLPWHTARRPVAEVACELGITCGVAGKIALDILLLAQSDVAEVRQGGAGGSSSAMPNKRNPTLAVAARACVLQAQAIVAQFLQSLVQEHERAAGAWQSEWTSLCRLFEISGAALSHVASLLGGLEVDAVRARSNLEAAEGDLMTESLFAALARVTGRLEARRLVDQLLARRVAERRSLEDAARSDQRIVGLLTEDGLTRALKPETALGANDALIERALARYRSRARRD
jgi:3-carboxy-cis,cis-muconate cycloisomerase